MRVIVHPGFHKTGTSSLQAFLASNRATLSAHCRIVLQDELKDQLRYSTRFATHRDPMDLAAFTASFAELCQNLPDLSAGTLLISSEGLSGRTPGKNAITTYAAAIPLAKAMYDALRAVFGRKAPLEFVYTTREAEAWLHSAWRHNLWGYPVTEDFAAFRQRYHTAADFDSILAAVQRLVPKAKVVNVLMETVMSSRNGMAEGVLRLLDLPDDVQAALVNPGARNQGWTADEAVQLLALNRAGHDPATLSQLKQQFRKNHPRT